MPGTTWIRIEISYSGDAEELGAILLLQGSAGAEIISPHRLACSVVQEDLPRFKDMISQLGAVIESIAEFAPIDKYLAEAAGGSVSEGRLTVRFVAVEEQAPAAAPGELLLIPGTGFGTGRHATTASLLNLLQSEAVAAVQPARALDFGTGSGLLALALAGLYRTQVTAVDNDELALENARQNLQINPALAALVTLKLGSFETIEGDFDIITANVYTELLVAAEPRFAAALAPGRILLLSGILRESAAEIIAAFSAERWREAQRLDRDEWVSFLFIRA